MSLSGSCPQIMQYLLEVLVSLHLESVTYIFKLLIYCDWFYITNLTDSISIMSFLVLIKCIILLRKSLCIYTFICTVNNVDLTCIVWRFSYCDWESDKRTPMAEALWLSATAWSLASRTTLNKKQTIELSILTFKSKISLTHWSMYLKSLVSFYA